VVARGFTGCQPGSELLDRIPRGQHVVDNFPVHAVGPPPRIDTRDWTFMLKFGRYPFKAWSCSEFNALRRTRITRNIHGVTSLSTLNIAWEGVAVDDVLAEAGDSAPTPLALTYAYDGYSNNVPIAEHPEAGAPARAASLLAEAIVTTVRLQTCAIPEIATRTSAINSWSFSPVRNVRDMRLIAPNSHIAMRTTRSKALRDRDDRIIAP
jgi:DMSO/TMAO reductase YedYZ molybdopterin-dependent catalytic subunit